MATKTFAAGDVLTASDVNTYLSHEGGAWTTWSPTYTNFTLGNGTSSAKYARVGRIIHFRLKVTLGSTSSVTGGIRISLPVEAAASDQLNGFYVLMSDATGSRILGGTTELSTTGVELNAFDSSGTYVAAVVTSATVPFTWTTSDYFLVVGTYESAS